MEYEILYGEAFPVVRAKLERGETLKAESDAMIAMQGGLDVEGAMEGNFLSALARKLLAGEKFFFQTISANRGPGTVLLGPSVIGGIIDVDLDGSYHLRVQKDGFLAATSGVTVETTMQNLAQGLFSKEGFFVLDVHGRGTIFLNSFGAIHAINLEPGEEAVIDNGHLVAWPDYMNYRIEKSSSGWVSSVMSGESLVCRFTGPGVVLIQTRKPEAFGQWLERLLPVRQSRG